MKRLVLLGLCLVLLLPHHFSRNVNETSRLGLVDNLIHEGKGYTDKSFYFNFVDMAYDKGHYYPAQLPTLATYTAVVLYPFKYFAHFRSEMGQSYFYYLATITTNGMALILLLFSLNIIFRRLGISENIKRMSALSILTGTTFLIYLGTYSTHVLEAVCGVSLLASIMTYRDKPILPYVGTSGLAAGLLCIIHPLSGIVFFISTGLYYLSRKLVHALLFLTVVGLLIGLGLGLHKGMHGTWKPYYFQPEKTMFVTDKGFPSAFLRNPESPGMNRDKVLDRMVEIGLPEDIRDIILSRYDKFHSQNKNPFHYMKEKFVKYDYLSISPLVVFSIFLIFGQLLNASFPYRREWVWALMSAGGLYAACVVLSSSPGICFSNRYLVAGIPILLAAASYGLQKNEQCRPFYQWLHWFGFVMLVAGTFRPWRSATDGFFVMSFWPSMSVMFVLLAYMILAPLRSFLHRFSATFFKNPWVWISCTVVLATAYTVSILHQRLTLTDFFRVQGYAAFFVAAILLRWNEKSHCVDNTPIAEKKTGVPENKEKVVRKF